MQVPTICVLASLTVAAQAFATEHVNFTPDEAVHNCLAEAATQLEERFGGSPTPIGTFETTETEDGWDVAGAYRVGGNGDERAIEVSCRVTADGTAVTTEPAGD